MNSQKGSLNVLIITVIAMTMLGLGSIWASIKSDNLRNEKHKNCLDTYVSEKMAGSLEEWLRSCMQ